MKFTKWIAISVAVALFICGCNGGGTELIISDISGPIYLAENSSVEFSIEAEGDTGIKYLWACEPASAGNFSAPSSATTELETAMVDADLPVTLRVTVSSDRTSPRVVEKAVEIRDIGGLTILGIEGPDSMEENSSEEFTANVAGDTGIVYEWSSDPPDAGTFTRPDEKSTFFRSGNFGADVTASITVVVSSNHFGPVAESRDIFIREVDVLYLDGIQGSTAMDETLSTTFTAIAGGDTGITYEWNSDPLSAGSFSNQSENMIIFTASEVDTRVPVNISVMVNSDHYGPVTRDQVVSVLNTPEYAWGQAWGGEGFDISNSLVQDSGGSVYASGYFCGNCDFDPGPGSLLIEAKGGSDGFICKYTPEGQLVWAKTWGLDRTERDAYMAISDQDEIYITGFYYGTTDLDPGPGVSEHTSSGAEDIFLSKFDTDGNLIWGRAWGGESQDDMPADLAVDGNGNVYITGSFRSVVDFDPGPGVYELESAGSTDCFLTCLDSSGNFRWAVAWGNENSDMTKGVAAGKDGEVYVSGTCMWPVDLDPGAGVYQPVLEEGSKVFLSRFDSGANFYWSRIIGDSTGIYLTNSAKSVGIDSQGNVIFTGYFSDSATDLNPGSGTDIHENKGEKDIFLIKLDSSGNYIFGLSWGGKKTDYPVGLGIDTWDNIYVTCKALKSDLDPGPGEYYLPEIDNYDNTVLSKFDPSGTFMWARLWDSCLSESNASVLPVSADAVYTTGYFMFEIDFDPGPDTDYHQGVDFTDSYLVKLVND